jgi:hypothetical protein
MISNDRWERRLAETAADFEYPPTPNVVAAVRGRLAGSISPTRLDRGRPARWAWALAALLLVLGLLLGVPQVRAAIVDFLQIGAVRIFDGAPTAEPTATPRPSASPLDSLLNLAGGSTLAAAEEHLGTKIPLPTYPSDLGEPDHVFVQELGGPVAILLWLEPERPDQVRLALYVLRLEGDAFAGKFEVDEVEEVQVNGRLAYWVRGEHVLQFLAPSGEPRFEPRRPVADNVLLWETGGTTFRLEGRLTRDEAIRIAESLG